MKTTITTSFISSIILAALVLAAPAQAADKLPETSPEGMVLLKDTKVRAVYAMPGASLDQYTKVAILDCYVAFVKNWERDHNRSTSLTGRVTADDMEKIKQALADEFRKVFTEELQEKRGYEIVDKTGDDVLVIRPALVNLDVTAPDLNTPAMTRTIVTSAGQMTLYMELYDSVSGAIIARIIDPQAADRGGFAMQANRMTNKVEADRILRRWAGLLGDHLGTVQAATERPEE